MQRGIVLVASLFLAVPPVRAQTHAEGQAGPVAPLLDCRTFPALGQVPFGVAPGDWNEDGRLDLAVSHSGSDTVGIFLGTARRQLVPGMTIDTGKLPRGLAAGDWNGDGHTDLVVPNGESNDVSVLLGDGKGSFSVGARLTAGVSPFVAALADLDGDGHPDIAVANETNRLEEPGEVTVFFGDGRGDVAAAVTVRMQDARRPAVLRVTQVDGKAGADVIVGNWWHAPGPEEAGVSLLTYSGPRTFTYRGTVRHGGLLSYGLATADFDGDGHVDAVVSDMRGKKLRLLKGDGSGGFVPAAELEGGGGMRWVEAADLNRDGHPDLISADTADGTVSLYFGFGDGRFAPRHPLPVGQGPRMVVTADLDADGRPDLAVANSRSHDVAVLFQTDGPEVACAPAR